MIGDRYPGRRRADPIGLNSESLASLRRGADCTTVTCDGRTVTAERPSQVAGKVTQYGEG